MITRQRELPYLYLPKLFTREFDLFVAKLLESMELLGVEIGLWHIKVELLLPKLESFPISMPNLRHTKVQQAIRSWIHERHCCQATAIKDILA